MKIPISSEIPTDRTDTPDLQDVLTRYIDSSREYSQAAGRMELADLSAMLGGVIITNVADAVGYKLDFAPIEQGGALALQLFLVMALMSFNPAAAGIGLSLAARLAFVALVLGAVLPWIGPGGRDFDPAAIPGGALT